VRSAAFALFAFALTHAGSAQDARQDMSDNAQAAISVCLAFYLIVADCAGSDAKSRTHAAAAIEQLSKMSAKASSAAHLQPADAQLRLDLNTFDQRALIGDSCAGIGTLRARYADQCGELIDKAASQ
jgi:hypothetical protein